MDAKSELRAQLRTRRHALSAEYVATNSSKIAHNVIHSVEWSQHKTVHIYQAISSENEVQTDEIIDYIAHSWPNIQLTIVGASAAAPMPQESFDLIIAPLLGFDRHNNRLGLGSGWYDRFLATQQRAKVIGLAFEVQRTDAIPVEAHDVALDSIVTENGRYEIGMPPVTATTSPVV